MPGCSQVEVDERECKTVCKHSYGKYNGEKPISYDSTIFLQTKLVIKSNLFSSAVALTRPTLALSDFPMAVRNFKPALTNYKRNNGSKAPKKNMLCENALSSLGWVFVVITRVTH